MSLRQKNNVEIDELKYLSAVQSGWKLVDLSMTLGLSPAQDDLFLITYWLRRHDTQHNDTQHNDIQHNDIQHDDIQHNDIHYNDIQHNDIQHNDIQHNDIQHNDIQHNDIQHIHTVLRNQALRWNSTL
jgi:hypothetical protein